MTQKIVVNACYGGFGLSAAGLEAFAKRKGVERLYWFTHDYGASGRIDFDAFIPTDHPDAEFSPAPFTVPEVPTDREAQNEAYYGPDIKRDDPDLLAVIDELGAAAYGKFAQLVVVEVPDGIEWQIEEYDGREWVAEAHRTWCPA